MTPPSPDLHITYDDCRRAGWCIEGVRRWFEKTGGDFDHFMQHGIAAADLIELRDDALTRRIIKAKMEAPDGRRR